MQIDSLKTKFIQFVHTFVQYRLFLSNLLKLPFFFILSSFAKLCLSIVQYALVGSNFISNVGPLKRNLHYVFVPLFYKGKVWKIDQSQLYLMDFRTFHSVI